MSAYPLSAHPVSVTRPGQIKLLTEIISSPFYVKTRGAYSYRRVVRLQFASSLVFKTRGSRWCDRNCVISSAYFTGKHMMGSGKRSAQNSVGKLAASQMTGYKVCSQEFSVPPARNKFLDMSIAAKHDLQYTSSRKPIKGSVQHNRWLINCDTEHGARRTSLS